MKWVSADDQKAGSKYTAEAYVSTATIHQLQQVQEPGKLLPAQQAQQYPPFILQEYLTMPGLPSILTQDAKNWTSGTSNMYDAATDIQDVLNSSFRYSLQITAPPQGTDPMQWFLTQKVGFCTYFATAMVLMARYLGMPSRVAMGFAEGQYSSKSNDYVVLGTQAHAWPQIYFGRQYGWINFEPTASFPAFGRGSSGTGSITGTSPTTPSTPSARTNRPNPIKGGKLGGAGAGAGNGGGAAPLLVGAGVGLTFIILLALLGAILLATWWRLLYRGLSPVVAAFARLAHLGAWAGVIPKRSQTPDEYVEQLSQLLPAQRPALERLSRLYARERWGGGLSDEAIAEVPRLYGDVSASITQRIADRLRRVPASLSAEIRRLLVGKHDDTGAGRTP